jgi:hypothetical protein
MSSFLGGDDSDVDGVSYPSETKESEPPAENVTGVSDPSTPFVPHSEPDVKRSPVHETIESPSSDEEKGVSDNGVSDPSTADTPVLESDAECACEAGVFTTVDYEQLREDLTDLLDDCPGDRIPWRSPGDDHHKGYGLNKFLIGLFDSSSVKHFDSVFRVHRDSDDSSYAEFYIDLFYRSRYWGRRNRCGDLDSLVESWNSFIARYSPAGVLSQLRRAKSKLINSDREGIAEFVHRRCMASGLHCAGLQYCPLCPRDAIRMDAADRPLRHQDPELATAILSLDRCISARASRELPSASSSPPQPLRLSNPQTPRISRAPLPLNTPPITSVLSPGIFDSTSPKMITKEMMCETIMSLNARVSSLTDELAQTRRTQADLLCALTSLLECNTARRDRELEALRRLKRSASPDPPCSNKKSS